MTAGEFTKVFTQAWQYAVRSGVSQPWKNSACASCWAATIERVAQFAEWLQAQPAKPEILAMIDAQGASSCAPRK